MLATYLQQYKSNLFLKLFDLFIFSILLTEKIDKSGDTSRVKITDFGLSKIIKRIDNNKCEMMTGMLGTTVKIK